MKKLLARLVRQSPAMAVAMLALFVALTGTAVATTSVLITGKQIQNNSITGLDIRNKSVAVADLAPRARGLRGPRGATGSTGAKGDTGPAGAPNPNAVNSDKLDNLDSADFLRSDGKAADSEKVDGYEANALIRFESVAFSGIPGTATLPLTAPSAGRVLLEAMCWAGAGGGGEIQVQFGLGNGSSTSFWYQHIPTSKDAMLVAHRVFTVAAGSTTTFSASRAYQSGSGGSCTNGTFSALFVPFKLDGST